MTAFQAEGCGGGFAADLKKGRGWRRGLCRRVVFASAQGATAPAALKVADCPSSVKVLRIDRPEGRRVLKFDGPSGRGLWWRLTPQVLKKGRGWRRGLCRRVEEKGS